MLARDSLSLNARAFVLLACVVMSLLQGFHAWQDRAYRLRSTQTVNGNLSHALIRHTEDTIGIADAVIISLVDQLERTAWGRDLQAQMERQMALQVAQSESIADLSVYDANGALLLSSLPSTPGSLNVSELAFFQHHRTMEDRGAFLGYPVTSPSRAAWKVTISRRWETPEHVFAGVVVASLNSASFANQYNALDLGVGSAINMFRADGTMLFRFPGDGTQLGRSFADTELFRVLLPQHPSGQFRYIAQMNGEDRVAAYDSSTRYPIVINVASSVGEVLADWRRETAWDVAGYGLLLAFIGTIGTRLARHARRHQIAERALAEQELHFRLLTEMSGDMVTRVGVDGRRTYVSPASEKLLGWAPEDLVGTQALQSIHPEDKPLTDGLIAALRAGTATDTTLAYRGRHRDGREVWIEASVRVTYDTETGICTGAVMISRDTTARKQLEAGLASLAQTDGLTGIANRRRLDEGLRTEWRRSAREGTACSFVLMDVDRFKAYNDLYGHLAGDECLRTLATILVAVMRRPGDLLARYGGEELTALLPRTDMAGALEVAEAARTAIEAASIPHEGSLPARIVTISIGVATAYPTPDMDPAQGIEMLLDAADRALYEAKNDGRNRIRAARATLCAALSPVEPARSRVAAL